MTSLNFLLWYPSVRVTSTHAHNVICCMILRRIICRWLIWHWGCGSNNPDSMVGGAYVGPTWDRQDTVGPHVCPINLVIREGISHFHHPYEDYDSMALSAKLPVKATMPRWWLVNTDSVNGLVTSGNKPLLDRCLLKSLSPYGNPKPQRINVALFE